MKRYLDQLRRLKQWADTRYGAFSRFVQFCLVGSLGMIVDLTVYWILLSFEVPLMASRALAIGIAMTFCFGLNRRFTFSYSRTDGIFAQYCRYVGSCSVGAVISWTVSVSLTRTTDLFALHPLIAAMVGIAAGLIFNFLMSHLWVFKVRHPEAGTAKRHSEADR